jgi:hypothetical protein
MCSITCAIDQRSGPGLKFHCASDNPLVASSTFLFVVSRYFIALSLSAWLSVCPPVAAAPANASTAVIANARTRFIAALLWVFRS